MPSAITGSLRPGQGEAVQPARVPAGHRQPARVPAGHRRLALALILTAPLVRGDLLRLPSLRNTWPVGRLRQ